MSINTGAALRQQLMGMDHKGYPAYKALKGAYSFGSYILSIEHVQGDPFAAPSRLSVSVENKSNGIPDKLYREEHVRRAVCDHLLRLFARQIGEFSRRAAGSGKSGIITVSRPGQQVLSRSACRIDPLKGDLKICFSVGFPANGRSINAGELEKILFKFIPECVAKSCVYENIDKGALNAAAQLAQDQFFIRQELDKRGLCAFVKNGSMLVRAAGNSDKPLLKGGLPFTSPKELEISLELPNAGQVRGMGIKNGITLIVGGGYHGKSTLLKALERGVYDHIKGDGREYVITRADAMKVRAEDGRSVKGLDISVFINNLPGKKDTVSFSTENASGSTSQAANLLEAVESGSRLLLIDEDTCATNFMIRDSLMEEVVERKKEPITPFIERVRALYDREGISTILVAGSSGGFFHVADTVIQMDEYRPLDITQKAKELALKYPETRPAAIAYEGLKISRRVADFDRAIRADDRAKLKSFGTDSIALNHNETDIRYMEQLIDQEQTNSLAAILLACEKKYFDGKTSLHEIADMMAEILGEEEYNKLSVGRSEVYDLAYVRSQEILGLLGRYRNLKLRS